MHRVSKTHLPAHTRIVRLHVIGPARLRGTPRGEQTKRLKPDTRAATRDKYGAARQVKTYQNVVCGRAPDERN